MEPADDANRADAGLRDVGPLRQLRDPELWFGGDYELGLAMPLGSLDIPTRLHLLRALWSEPHLTGVVCDKQELGDPWLPIDEALAGRTRLYGCLRMGERLVGCYTQFLDNDYEAWCLLCIPMGMVEQLYTVNYGEYEANAWWESELDAFLAQIAMRVYAQVPFELGILGHEASAELIYLDKLGPQFLTQTNLLIPDAQFARFGVFPHGFHLGKGLWWTGGVG